MKELNSIKIIAIDHGYGNIKTANTVTPTGITVYETELIFTGNILEYNGRYYQIGDGHKEFVSDKCMDEDYYLLTMMGIARELRREQITILTLLGAASTHRAIRRLLNTLRILKAQTYLQT